MFHTTIVVRLGNNQPQPFCFWRTRYEWHHGRRRAGRSPEGWSWPAQQNVHLDTRWRRPGTRPWCACGGGRSQGNCAHTRDRERDNNVHVRKGMDQAMYLLVSVMQGVACQNIWKLYQVRIICSRCNKILVQWYWSVTLTRFTVSGSFTVFLCHRTATVLRC